MSQILILATGGTIDDLEYDREDDAPAGTTSLIPSFLQAIGTSNAHCELFMLKDSQFINDTDRAMLLERIQKAPETRILVTHGTKTMVETAKFLGPHITDKVIVLTGCMTLPRNDQGKDAMASLKFALDVLDREPGVYIAMHGKVFCWDKVKKNIEKNRFEL